MEGLPLPEQLGKRPEHLREPDLRKTDKKRKSERKADGIPGGHVLNTEQRLREFRDFVSRTG